MSLSRKDRIVVWLRLLLLQGSWNFERLQGLGIFYALLPALKKLYRNDALLDACRRHIGYFNTHPYMAPAVAGVVLKLEEERAVSGEEQLSSVEFKEMVAAPYAAIGDALFWGGLRPLTAGIALLLVINGVLWAPLIYLLVFNSVAIWFRISGFVRGYRQGVQSLGSMQRRHLPDWAVHSKKVAIMVFGAFSALLVFQQLQRVELPGWIGLLAVVPMILLGLAARRGVSSLLLLVLTTIVILLICLL